MEWIATLGVHDQRRPEGIPCIVWSGASVPANLYRLFRSDTRQSSLEPL
jgi:hypothetical protein